MNTDHDTLRAWTDAAWGRHDRAPREVLADLTARAPLLPDDDDGDGALYLAEHVALGHLGDAAARQAFAALLARVPPHPRLAAGVARGRWALAAASGEAPPAAPLAVRCRALGHAALALTLQGHAAEARALLFGPEAEALASDDAAVRRALAASAHNVAGHLMEAPRGPEPDALMVDAARLARRAWETAGTWLNVERADWYLAHCLVTAGDADAALAAAQACLARCEAENADAYERFFGHEAVASAQRARGDTAAVATQRARMAALLPEVGDEQRAYCEKTLAAL